VGELDEWSNSDQPLADENDTFNTVAVRR